MPAIRPYSIAVAPRLHFANDFTAGQSSDGGLQRDTGQADYLPPTVPELGLLGSNQRVFNVAEDPRQLRTDCGEGADDGDADEACNQTIFDGRGARLVF